MNTATCPQPQENIFVYTDILRKVGQCKCQHKFRYYKKLLLDPEGVITIRVCKKCGLEE